MLLAGGAGASPSSIALVAPVDGPVVRAFSADGAYGPGHRGLDLRAMPGTPVLAPVGGRVTFAGSVAGVRWVTLAPEPRVLVTVGPLTGVGVRSGDVVVSGTLLGVVAAGHAGALHLSVRLDGRYVDPAPLLVGAGWGRATLLPIGGPVAGERPVTAVPQGRVR